MSRHYAGELGKMQEPLAETSDSDDPQACGLTTAGLWRKLPAMGTRLDSVEKHHQEVLDLLARVINMSDERIAVGCGMSRQTVQGRRVGTSRIRPGEVARFAAALDVPTFCFDMSISDLLHWLGDQAPTDRFLLYPGCEQLELVEAV
jgi:hypothetical protein